MPEQLYLIFLATEDDWCSLSLSKGLPDFCAITDAYPQITIWDATPTPPTGGPEGASSCISNGAPTPATTRS